jgi:hypothetical protein
VKAEQAAQLRAPFPPEQIGKLPRVWCRACTANKTARHCDAHKIIKCDVCKAKVTEAHLHLDYVGHAATTDRLLHVDPDWTWAPVAHGQDGLPAFDANGGLWISLTVCGVTRLGYGDQGLGKGAKEAIGDAIRNAAMRFGVALDLWAKEDLLGEVSESPRSVSPRPARAPKASSSAAAPPTGDEHERVHAQPATSDLKLPPQARGVITAAQVKKMWTIARGYSLGDEQVKEIVVNVGGVGSSKLIPRAKFEAVLKEIELTGRGVQA